MKKQVLKMLFTFSMIILGVVACQKDTSLEQFSPQKVKDANKYHTYSPEKINDVRLAFAKTLSSAIREEELRKYIHASMQKRLASNIEMVYIAEKNKIVFGGKTLAQILTEYADADILNKFGKDFFNNITDIVPLLTIAMPSTERWDASTWNTNYVPNVAAVLELSSSNKKDFTTFREGIELTTELRSGDPNDPTLTVWNAEISYLIDMDGYTPTGNDIDNSMPSGPPPPGGQGCEEIYQEAINMQNAYTVSGYTFFLVLHDQLIAAYNLCLGNIATGGASGGGGCTKPCPRDCETLEETLVDFKINGWGVFTNIRRSWFEDYFVFHGDVLGIERNSLNGTVQGFAKKFVSTSYKKGGLLNCGNPCEGRFKLENYLIRPDWDLAEFGDRYKISWSEVDDGSTTQGFSIPLSAKFKIKIPGVGETEISQGVTFSFQKTIGPVVELGSQDVFYCHEINRENNTGSITFRCN